MKKLAGRYLVFIAGLYFLAAGIVLILRSSLGTTPISSVNYVLSLHSPLTLGACTFLLNTLLIAGQFWFVRDRRTRRDTVEILLQLPFSLLFGLFIDCNMALTQNLRPQHYAASVALLLAGCLVQAIGVVLEIKPRVAMMSAEGFVKYGSKRYDKDFGKFKVGFDITLVAAATLLSLALARQVDGVREGTVAAACLTGYIVSFLNRKIMTRAMLHRILPVR
ncbi:YczE/YyaS/YitT family protein [Alistipes sp.]|uniref:YczE/YyaS/YitT family protein n=1 Tax=Alistipes sp. TaxID=1872444 RepID=UPI0011C82384